jgi:hypothetical protein
MSEDYTFYGLGLVDIAEHAVSPTFPEERGDRDTGIC